MDRRVNNEGNSRARGRPVQASDAQALAALGAPGVEHGTAAARLHPDEETMRAGALDLGGLVGALHGWPVTVVAKEAGLEKGGFGARDGQRATGPAGHPWVLQESLDRVPARTSRPLRLGCNVNPGNP